MKSTLRVITGVAIIDILLVCIKYVLGIKGVKTDE